MTRHTNYVYRIHKYYNIVNVIPYHWKGGCKGKTSSERKCPTRKYRIKTPYEIAVDGCMHSINQHLTDER